MASGEITSVVLSMSARRQERMNELGSDILGANVHI